MKTINAFLNSKTARVHAFIFRNSVLAFAFTFATAAHFNLIP